MKTLMQMLSSLEDPTPAVVEAMLEKFCIGVVILRSEHQILNEKYRSSMPSGWDELPIEKRDPFARYVIHPSLTLRRVCD
jgi:hypothetical protein